MMLSPENYLTLPEIKINKLKIMKWRWSTIQESIQKFYGYQTVIIQIIGLEMTFYPKPLFSDAISFLNRE